MQSCSHEKKCREIDLLWVCKYKRPAEYWWVTFWEVSLDWQVVRDSFILALAIGGLNNLTQRLYVFSLQKTAFCYIVCLRSAYMTYIHMTYILVDNITMISMIVIYWWCSAFTKTFTECGWISQILSSSHFTPKNKEK